MKRTKPPAILSAAVGLVLLWHAAGIGAQPILATGEDADITAEGLHRIHPSIMEAAWVRPDLDLSRYSRLLLMPSAVQFRDVKERSNYAIAKLGGTEFALNDEKKEWLREVWTRAVAAEFEQKQSFEIYNGAGADVLVVQGFLVDIVSRIPPERSGSNYSYVRDPWIASVVLELRDATTTQLLARTIDQRHAEGLVDAATVWPRTEDLIERWAHVLAERLQQLSDLGAPGPRTPSWAR